MTITPIKPIKMQEGTIQALQKQEELEWNGMQRHMLPRSLTVLYIQRILA
ncbi:UNVERIFIED_CONTAM: hypothetical protein FKN15_000778 [Acipenser sinensis]